MRTEQGGYMHKRHYLRLALALFVMVTLSSILFIQGTVHAAHALNNGLALTPPMGWNSWNRFGCNVNETVVKQAADAMVSSGMAAAGYQYVNIDDCWLTHSRDGNGNLVPDPNR